MIDGPSVSLVNLPVNHALQNSEITPGVRLHDFVKDWISVQAKRSSPGSLLLMGHAGNIFQNRCPSHLSSSSRHDGATALLHAPLTWLSPQPISKGAPWNPLYGGNSFRPLISIIFFSWSCLKAHDHMWEHRNVDLLINWELYLAPIISRSIHPTLVNAILKGKIFLFLISTSFRKKRKITCLDETCQRIYSLKQ